MNTQFHIKSSSFQTFNSLQFFIPKTMHEIIPGVYLGPYSAAQRSSLIENDITCIVCVRQEYEANFITPHISDPTFAYLLLDIADNVTENIIRFFPKVRQFIDEALSNNRKVLVHGNTGNSRSATLVLAYIMEKFGLTSRYVRNKFSMSIKNDYCQ